MAIKNQIPAKAKIPEKPRASVTFPSELYRTLEVLAKRKKSPWHGSCAKRPKSM